jgi:hypothetical protein
VLNEYLTAKDRCHIQANYERDYKKYENVPQPVIAVDANINIIPSASFDGTATSSCRTRLQASQIHHESFNRSPTLVGRPLSMLYFQPWQSLPTHELAPARPG